MFWEIIYHDDNHVMIKLFDGKITNDLFKQFVVEFLEIFKYSKSKKQKLTIIIDIKFLRIPPLNFIYKFTQWIKKIKNLSKLYLEKLYFIVNNDISKNLLTIIFAIVKPVTPYQIIYSANLNSKPEIASICTVNS